MFLWIGIDLEYSQRLTFRVNYVDGFISGSFRYVVAIQPEELDTQNSDYVSKIRVSLFQRCRFTDLVK